MKVNSVRKLPGSQLQKEKTCLQPRCLSAILSKLSTCLEKIAEKTSSIELLGLFQSQSCHDLFQQEITDFFRFFPQRMCTESSSRQASWMIYREMPSTTRISLGFLFFVRCLSHRNFSTNVCGLWCTDEMYQPHECLERIFFFVWCLSHHYISSSVCAVKMKCTKHMNAFRGFSSLYNVYHITMSSRVCGVQMKCTKQRILLGFLFFVRCILHRKLSSSMRGTWECNLNAHMQPAGDFGYLEIFITLHFFNSSARCIWTEQRDAQTNFW